MRGNYRRGIAVTLLLSIFITLLPSYLKPIHAAGEGKITSPYFTPEGTATEGTQTKTVPVIGNKQANPVVIFTQKDDGSFLADSNLDGEDINPAMGGTDSTPYPVRTPFKAALDVTPYKPDRFEAFDGTPYPIPSVTNVKVYPGDATYVETTGIYFDPIPGDAKPAVWNVQDGHMLVYINVGGPEGVPEEMKEDGELAIRPNGYQKWIRKYPVDMNLTWVGEVVTTKTLNASTQTSTLNVGDTSDSTATVTTTGYQASGDPVDVNHNPSTTTWRSNQPSIASIDPATGRITGVSAGTANITVKWEKADEYGDTYNIERTFPVTVVSGDTPPPDDGGTGTPGAGEITGDFDIIPPTINYRDSFTLQPRDIEIPTGCTYSYHKYMIDGKGELPNVKGQTQASTYNHGSYPWNIGVGSHQFYIKVVGSCGESAWIGPKTLTINGPPNNEPPFFKLGWFNNGDTTGTTPRTRAVQGDTLMVRVIETPDSDPPSPSDPDGDHFRITGWDYSYNSWTQSLPGTYGFHPMAEYIDGIRMDQVGIHRIQATMTDDFGAAYTASATIEVISSNPVPVITGPTQVKEGRPLPSPFSSANSYSPIGRSIDHTRDEWTNKKTTYTTPGTEIIRLHVYDDQGAKSLTPASHTLTVLPDQPPIAKLEIVPLGLRNQTYYVYNKSTSPDGDAIVSTQYRYRYDATNNGFADDTWVNLAGDAARAAFTPTRVGKYQFYVSVCEDYGKCDDTLSEPLHVTTLDVTNLAPSVSFAIEGSNPDPDLNPVTPYSPTAIYTHWTLYETTTTKAISNMKGQKWTVDTQLIGGLGRFPEKPDTQYFSGGGYTPDATMFPFRDNGYGPNSLNPYRPIQTNNSSTSQPLLVPKTGGGYEVVEWSTEEWPNYYTNRTHFYFQYAQKWYAFNKSKISAYSGGYDGVNNIYNHELAGGSPYDYIIDSERTLQNLNTPLYYAKKKWDHQRYDPWVIIPESEVPASTAYEYEPISWFYKTLAFKAGENTLYQLVQVACNYCQYDDEDGWQGHIFNVILTYDLKTGEFLKSSLAHKDITASFNLQSFIVKGDLLLTNNNTLYNREAEKVGQVDIPDIPPYVGGSGYTFETAGSSIFYVSPEGEYYFSQITLDTERVSSQADHFIGKLRPDLTLAWRVQIAGKGSNGSGSDPMARGRPIVNPIKNEIIVKSAEATQFYVSEYYTQIINMNTGAIRNTTAHIYNHDTAQFGIDWNGNYRQGHYGSYAPNNLYTDRGTTYRMDGTLYSSIPSGGTYNIDCIRGSCYESETGVSLQGEYIGDGLLLNVFMKRYADSQRPSVYVPWLNSGTPSNEPMTVRPFSLGQWLSGFNAGNVEIDFTMSLDDADGDQDFAGMTFRAANSLNKYTVETDGARLYLAKYINGTRTVLQQSNYPFQDGTSVNITIRALGSKLEVLVGGVPYFSVTDTSYASGKIGPFSDKSYVRFGTVTTKALAAPTVTWESDYALWDAGSARAEVRYSNITFTDPENDPIAGSYQWRYTHTPKFINNQGTSALHNKTYTTAQLYFDKVGVYDVLLSARDDPHPSYRHPSSVFDAYRQPSNEFGRRIIVHRKPVAQFTLSLNADNTVRYTDTSYDPDRWASASNYSAPEDGKNYQTTRGIFDRRYYYVTPSGSYTEAQLTRPSEQGVYQVGLAVRDEYGAWSDWTVQTIQIDNPFPANALPVATMTYPTGTQASPTMTTALRPLLRWTQTDADAGTVFRRYQLQVTNEANTAYILDTGELAQNTSSTTASYIPTVNLPSNQKLRVRVRVNDGLEWGAWSAQTWLLINRAPTAALTYPTGTQASPTVLTTKRPTIHWKQTDPDAGTVFRYYEVEIINEANTAVVRTSGQASQNTGSTTASWTVPVDLPNGKLQVRVRVHDGYTWSAWSAVRWMIANRPPVADFSWTPSLIYEGDRVQLINRSTDPDGDPLTYLWTITRPDGTAFARTTTDVTLDTVAKGAYTVRLRATDPSGSSHEVTKQIQVTDLSIAGQVTHTPEWEQYRQSWNDRFPARRRSESTFWAGEALVLRADVTDTGSSATKPSQVTATLLATGTEAELSSGNWVAYTGVMVDADFRQTLTDGAYVMRFRVVYSNGHVETDDVPFEVAGNIYDVIVNQQRL